MTIEEGKNFKIDLKKKETARHGTARHGTARHGTLK